MAAQPAENRARLLAQLQNWEKTLTESDAHGCLEIPLEIATVLCEYFPAPASQEELVFLYNGVEEFGMTLCFGQAGQDAAPSHHTFFRETEWVPFVQRHRMKQGDTVSFDRIWYPKVMWEGRLEEEPVLWEVSVARNGEKFDILKAQEI